MCRRDWSTCRRKLNYERSTSTRGRSRLSLKQRSRSWRQAFPRSQTGLPAKPRRNNTFSCGRRSISMSWIRRIASSGFSPSRREVDRRSSVQWYQIDGGQVIAVFAPPPSTSANRTSVSRRMVYRIASDGAIQDRFEVELANRIDQARANRRKRMGLALGIPAPAVLFVVNLLLVIWDDQIPSYPAAFTALLKDSGPSLIAVAGSVIDPGRHGLAAESRSSGFLAKSKSPGRSLCSCSVYRLTWGFDSIVAGRSASPVRIARPRFPATVWRARSAEHSSLILP